MTDNTELQIQLLGQRIRAMRTAKGMNQKDFAALMGVGVTSQQQYEAGKTPPGADYIFRLSAHGANLTSLMTGEQQPTTFTASLRSALQDSADLVDVDEVDLAFGFGSGSAEDADDGGVGIVKHRFPVAWLRSITTTSPKLLTFARGRGDSMMPTLLDGDLMLIDRSQRIIREQDAIWALVVGDIAMTKRVRVLGNSLQLLSDNSHVPPYLATQDETNVVGRVIFIGRNL